MIDKLHYISQANAAGSHIPAIERALLAGCKWIQLRIKDQSHAFINEQAVQAKVLCDSFNAKLIVNDHTDIARNVGAYGVHLGLQDMPLAEARKIVGQDIIIGGTANTLEDVLQRIQEGADYIGLGPLRFTTTKRNLSPLLGVAGFQNMLSHLAVKGISIPIVAIGGLTIGDVPTLMKAGIYGIAVSSLITNADDPRQVVEALYAELKSNLST